jgi:hypothetical protein
MSIFTKAKTKSGKHRLTFSKKYFNKLITIHPYATCLIISELCKINNGFIDPDQHTELDYILKSYKKPKKSLDQHYLEQWFVNGFRMLDLDLEEAPDILDKIYKKIYS